MFKWCLAWVVGWLRPKAVLIAENVCLRQQLTVALRKRPRPRIANQDRLFWILAARLFSEWRGSLVLVTCETVARWQRKGWKAYWRWKCRRPARLGRRRIPLEVRELIRRMAKDNLLWGQQRIQAELSKLGYMVCSRTVAKYMRRPYGGSPSPQWKRFLAQHAKDIWACDFLCVRTVTFQTLYVFFIIHHGSREIVHARVTKHPSASWTGQQIVNACDWAREPSRYLIRDRDGIFGDAFNKRVTSLGIKQVRTPVRAPKANAVAERWVGTARRECLDRMVIYNERHLQRIMTSFVDYYNHHRPHRSLGQRPPCPEDKAVTTGARILAEPVLGGLHHIYSRAA